MSSKPCHFFLANFIVQSLHNGSIWKYFFNFSHMYRDNLEWYMTSYVRLKRELIYVQEVSQLPLLINFRTIYAYLKDKPPFFISKVSDMGISKMRQVFGRIWLSNSPESSGPSDADHGRTFWAIGTVPLLLGPVRPRLMSPDSFPHPHAGPPYRVSMITIALYRAWRRAHPIGPKKCLGTN